MELGEKYSVRSRFDTNKSFIIERKSRHSRFNDSKYSRDSSPFGVAIEDLDDDTLDDCEVHRLFGRPGKFL